MKTHTPSKDTSRLQQGLIIAFLPLTISVAMFYYVVLEPLIDYAAGWLIEWSAQENDLDRMWR